MAYDQSVRTLMQNAGYNGKDIGYDTNTGNVTYQGKNFMRPQMNVNGTTYTDMPTFNQAHQAFQQKNPQYAFMNSAEDNMPVDQRFAYYASNPDKGSAELSRVNQKIGYLQGLSAYNPEAQNQLQAADTYKKSLLSVLGQNAPQQPGQTSANDLISTVLQRVQHPQPYDVYSSPEYNAAKSAADYAAQQDVRAAQEALGQSGFGRSTNLADRAQQIQQGANERLLTQIMPQLIAQHRALDQQQTGNLENLISPLLQQQQNQVQNQFTQAGLTGVLNGQQTLAGQQAQAALTGKLANGSPTFQAQQQEIANAINRANAFGAVTNPEDAALLGVPVGTDTRALQQMINQMNYQNAELGLKQQSNEIAQQRADNQASANSARSGYYTAKANQINNPSTAPSAAAQKNDLESTYVSNIDQMTPDNRDAFFKNEKSKIIKDLGVAGYNSLYGMYYDTNGVPKE